MACRRFPSRGAVELTIVYQDGFAPANYRLNRWRHPKQQRECRIVARSFLSYRTADRDVIQFVPGKIVRANWRRNTETEEGEPTMMELIPSKRQGLLRFPIVGKGVVAARCNDRPRSREWGDLTVHIESTATPCRPRRPVRRNVAITVLSR